LNLISSWKFISKLHQLMECPLCLKKNGCLRLLAS
jgi:hypothetical protein